MTVIDLPNQNPREAGKFDDRRVGSAIDEPVTGPLPVVDLAEGHLHVTERRGVVIAALDGALDDGLVSRVVPALTSAVAGAAAVVVDLDHVTLLEPAPLEAVLEALDAAPPEADRCLITGRLSGRMVLDRWGVSSRHVIFSSVADALQARAFAESGYGSGWDSTQGPEPA